MDENKDKTVKFEPVTDESIKKEEIRRRNDDVYSEKRHSSAHEEEERGNSLLYVVIALSVVIIIVLVAGIFMLGKIDSGKLPEENITKEELLEEKEEALEEEAEEEKEETVICDIVFYGDSVIRKNSGYSILADIYENDKKTDHRKILIDQSTKIYEDGERMNAEGFIYTIESLAGEMIFVQSEIREEDGYAISLRYDLGLDEAISEEEPSEENTEEEITDEEITDENEGIITEAQESSDNNEAVSEGVEGIVVE